MMEITDNIETVEAEVGVVPEEDVITYLKEEETKANTEEQESK